MTSWVCIYIAASCMVRVNLYRHKTCKAHMDIAKMQIIRIVSKSSFNVVGV